MVQNKFLGTIGWIKSNLMISSQASEKGYSNENFYPGAPNIPDSGSENIVKLEWIGFNTTIPSIISQKVQTGANVSWSWTAQIGHFRDVHYNTVGGGLWDDSSSRWSNVNTMTVSPGGTGLRVIYGSSYQYKDVTCDIFQKHTYTFSSSTRKFQIDGVDKLTFSSSSNFTEAHPFQIWYGWCAISKYYSLEIYQDGELVEKIVPVLKGGKPYFMDEIDGTLYEIKTEDFVTNLDMEKGIAKLGWIGFTKAIPSVYSSKVKISNNVSWIWDAEIGERNSSYTRLIGDGDYTTSNGTWANGNQLQIVSNSYSGDLNLVFGSSYETVSCDTAVRHTYMFQGASTRQFKIDGTVKTTMPAATFSTDMSFRIWHGLRPINKYYSLQIYENGVLAEKIVPVLNNGKPYFMDEIDGTMYPIETEDFFYDIAS